MQNSIRLKKGEKKKAWKEIRQRRKYMKNITREELKNRMENHDKKKQEKQEGKRAYTKT